MIDSLLVLIALYPPVQVFADFIDFYSAPLYVLCLIFLIDVLKNPQSLHVYRDAFEKPNTSVHSINYYGIPVVDFGITFVGASVFAYCYGTNLFVTFVVSYLWGQLLHYIFGVNTRFFNNLGIKFDDVIERPKAEFYKATINNDGTIKIADANFKKNS